MYATSKPRRIALAAIAVGSLTFLAACGGDTSAADGGDAGSGDSTESAAADGGRRDHRVLAHRAAASRP